jgi:L-amino acid N-acyltransferase YncA
MSPPRRLIMPEAASHAMPESAGASRTLPYTTKVGNGNVTFRLMTPQDRDAFLAFMRAQPKEDQFFLLVDVTSPEGMQMWMHDLENGRNSTVLAEENGKLLGYSSLHHGQTSWTRHLGEIRLLVSPDQRGRGLGQMLGRDAFAIAHKLGLQRTVVRVASGQKGARRLFERLGFHMEALLADWVIDRQGRTQDLVLMSYDVAGFHG